MGAADEPLSDCRTGRDGAEDALCEEFVGAGGCGVDEFAEDPVGADALLVPPVDDDEVPDEDGVPDDEDPPDAGAVPAFD